MKFKISRVYGALPLPDGIGVENVFSVADMGFYGQGEITVDTLEQLLELCRKVKNPLILSEREQEWELEIYDDYRE